MQLIPITLCLVFFVGFTSLQAQTCCSAGAPVTSSFDIDASKNKSILAQINYEYNSVNRLVSNNEILRNDPRNRNGQNWLLKTDFVLTNKWAFTAFLPYVIQNRTTISESENANGIGDLSLLSQYTHPLKDSQLKFSLGAKLPTGQQYLQDNRGINLSPDMQSGSGTVDFLARIAWTKTHFLIPNLNNASDLSFRGNGTNKHFGDPTKEAGRQFKFGDEIQLTSALSYLFLVKNNFIVPELGLRIRYAFPNKEEAINAPNSGGFWFNMPLGFQIKPNQNYSIRVFGEIPVHQQLRGLQITTDYRVGIQFRYQFSISKKEETLEKLTPFILEK